MSDRLALVTVEDIARAYDFGASHPLRPERVLLTYERIRTLGLDDLPNVEEIRARSALEAEVLRVHRREFVDVVKGIDDGSMDERYGFAFGLGTGDNPIFKSMYPASLAVCGASLTAAEAVSDGRVEHSFNPAGGLHHARAAEASGFCIFNDPAVAIAALLDAHPGWRVMYIDVDVHHGDGVQWIFYDDPRVLTLSLHQSGRYLYPGTGFEDETGSGAARGTSANLPLPPLTGNDDYLWALENMLEPLCSAFRPDVLVTQLGADTHYGDPLANLGLTLAAYPRMAELLHQAAHTYAGGRWVATGGGGYQATTVVPIVWSVYFAEMCGKKVPAEWLEDSAPADVARPARAELEQSLETVLGECLPRLQELVSQ